MKDLFAILKREIMRVKKGDKREEDKVERCDGNERGEWRYEGKPDLRDLFARERERENLVLDSLI